MPEESPEEKIAFICQNQPEPMNFLWAFFQWVHLIDDLVDRDKERSVEEVARISLEMALTAAKNSFFQANRDFLLPLIVQTCTGWADSEILKHRADALEEPLAILQREAVSDVLKSSYHEVFWQVGLLVGGWEHMRECQRRYRAFDFEAVLATEAQSH